ncbi:MAG: TonB-dependent receptor, partial [Rhodothermales bacterium]|nr:TonB-dependent receptor [Rhodothermales bacterium]
MNRICRNSMSVGPATSAGSWRETSVRMLVVLAVLAMQSTAAFAGTKGKITGRVIDGETGTSLPGANVLLVGTMLGASSNLDGEFLIVNIPPRKYTVQISMVGFQTQTVEGVSVKADLTTKLGDIVLYPQVFQGEEIVITAQQDLITKDMTATQAVVGADQINALPVEEFGDVVQLQAGVSAGRDGELHIRGGRSEEVVYMVDGVAVSDVYSGDIAVEVENSSIQELQVISGTFNAEYGRAMSGVVNIVTRDGGDRIGGSVTLYGGDYLTRANDVFFHLDDVNPLAVSNLQFSFHGPVPFTNRRLKFFTTGRVLTDDGYIFGEREFVPSDFSSFSADDSTQWAIQATGDGEAVPLRPLKKTTLHGKLSYRVSANLNVAGSLIWNDVETQDWRAEGKEATPENQAHNFHRFRLNPDGASTQFQNGYTALLSANHLLGTRTFYNVNLSAIYNQAESYVYDDPFDPRNQDQDLMQNVSDNAFFTGGTDPWQTRRSTRSLIAAFDLTSQATDVHQIRTGLEVRSHELEFEEFKIIPARNESGIEITPFQPALPPPESPFNNRYRHRPLEVAAFVQDKIELDNLIVNIGLRFDSFNPNAPVPTDPRDPANPDKRKDAGVKSQLSPRLGLAFPITEKGVLHFSYGYFFQMPLFQYLYANSEFEVEIGRL